MFLANILLVLTIMVMNNLCLVSSSSDPWCDRLSLEPPSKMEELYKKNWKIYHVWNMAKDELECMAITFRKANSVVINRIWTDMSEYLVDQPPWANATILMTVVDGYEMLLFADKNLPGRFTAVLNVIRSELKKPKTRTVPLYRLHINIYFDGRYVLLTHCDLRVTMILGHLTPFQREMEFIAEANTLLLTGGNMVCKTSNRLAPLNFESIKLLGKIWKIYYSWNMDKHGPDACSEVVTFKNATMEAITRVGNETNQYMDYQPAWEHASLLMNVTGRYEILLYPDKDVPGRFTGVPNIIKTDSKKSKAGPQIGLLIKIYFAGSYILIAYLNDGIVRLLSHLTPLRRQVEMIAQSNSLLLDEGYRVCYFDINKLFVK